MWIVIWGIRGPKSKSWGSMFGFFCSAPFHCLEHSTQRRSMFYFSVPAAQMSQVPRLLLCIVLWSIARPKLHDYHRMPSGFCSVPISPNIYWDRPFSAFFPLPLKYLKYNLHPDMLVFLEHYETKNEIRHGYVQQLLLRSVIYLKIQQGSMDAQSPCFCSSNISDDSKLWNMHCSVLEDQNMTPIWMMFGSSGSSLFYYLYKMYRWRDDVLFLCLCRSKISKGSKHVFP